MKNKNYKLYSFKYGILIHFKYTKHIEVSIWKWIMNNELPVHNLLWIEQLNLVVHEMIIKINTIYNMVYVYILLVVIH